MDYGAALFVPSQLNIGNTSYLVVTKTPFNHLKFSVGPIKMLAAIMLVHCLPVGFKSSTPRPVLWDAFRGPSGLHWDRVHDEAVATSYIIWDDPNQRHLRVHFSQKGGRWHVDQVKVIDHYL
jgi:hypothetical protein